MEAKWPFLLITFVLLVALGFTIVGLERGKVLSNWDKRRCDLPVMFMSSFFKPDGDPRTTGEFAKENIEFCMKTYVDQFMSILMTPIEALFGKHLNIASQATTMLNGIRQLAQTLYNSFLSYLGQYFNKFTASVFEMSRIVQYIRMAASRANAMVMSMLYSAIALFRGMINAIQFVIKVVLIICGIMLVIIIILWFILFPVIPIILGTLAAVTATVMAMAGVLSASISADAQDKAGGFCFATGSRMRVYDPSGTRVVPVEEIRVGDDLGPEGGKVTCVIQMEGKGIPMYNLQGILVSGSHLVKGVDGHWKCVEEDPRAKKTSWNSPILYCFNTTTNCIPILTTNLTPILFRDWEEIDNEDANGQYIWNYLVSRMLNENVNYDAWKDNLKSECEVSLLGKEVLIKTSKGWIPISQILLSDATVLDYTGMPQIVRGVVYGEVEHALEGDHEWVTESYVYEEGAWKRSVSTVKPGSSTVEGRTLITETGTFVIWDGQKEKIIRDFTEVGYQSIHKTYAFVEARLRATHENI